MNLHISQSISQKQSFVVSAQLQQAIHMLQMSNVDLQSYIESEAEQNPFIDVERSQTNNLAPKIREPRMKQTASSDFDYVNQMAQERGLSLYEHVSRQFDTLFGTGRNRAIAETFLEALEPSGWLGESLDVLAEKTALPLKEAEEFLFELQKVEPTGIFARSLSECLALQADERGWMTPVFCTVLENLNMLAKADLRGLAKKAKCNEIELRQVLKNLRCLNPKPGADFDLTEGLQRAPDLIVTRGQEGWNIDLNRSNLPTVTVDEKFAKNASAAKGAEEYVGERLSIARWLQRALEYRNNTTLAVGAEIVRRQVTFFEEGPAGLKPMILRDVAQKIGIHESTVSRITTGMMIQTPHGTYPLKMFFNAALGGSNDDPASGSSAAVRHKITHLVKGEDPKKPLSDDTLAKMVSEGGVPLARRTVAKYRDMLGIPSSFERRRQALLSA